MWHVCFSALRGIIIFLTRPSIYDRSQSKHIYFITRKPMTLSNRKEMPIAKYLFYKNN
jgi:hypothetical protein